MLHVPSLCLSLESATHNIWPDQSVALQLQQCSNIGTQTAAAQCAAARLDMSLVNGHCVSTADGSRCPSPQAVEHHETCNRCHTSTAEALALLKVAHAGGTPNCTHSKPQSLHVGAYSPFAPRACAPWRPEGAAQSIIGRMSIALCSVPHAFVAKRQEPTSTCGLPSCHSQCTLPRCTIQVAAATAPTMAATPPAVFAAKCGGGTGRAPLHQPAAAVASRSAAKKLVPACFMRLCCAICRGSARAATCSPGGVLQCMPHAGGLRARWPCIRIVWPASLLAAGRAITGTRLATCHLGAMHHRQATEPRRRGLGCYCEQSSHPPFKLTVFIAERQFEHTAPPFARRPHVRDSHSHMMCHETQLWGHCVARVDSEMCHKSACHDDHAEANCAMLATTSCMCTALSAHQMWHWPPCNQHLPTCSFRIQAPAELFSSMRPLISRPALACLAAATQARLGCPCSLCQLLGCCAHWRCRPSGHSHPHPHPHPPLQPQYP